MKFKSYILSIVFVLIAITTYSQIDSLESRRIYNWKLDPYDLSLQLVELDTSLASFQNFNPLLKNTISSNYLGNLGSAAQSKIYYDRKIYKTGFVFSEPYAIYFHLPKDQLYFNTKRQFTLFNYGSGGPKNESEQVLGVLHTQNVNKDFNFGFDYDMISSDGRYQNQQVKQNKITLFSSYQKKGYRLHVNVGLNRVKAQENGGIDSLHYLGSDEYKNRKNIPVKLDDARNQVFNTGFYLAQEYRFGKTIEEITVVEKKEVPLEDFSLNKSKNGFQKQNNSTDSIANNIDSTTVEINNLLSDTTLSDSITIISNNSVDTVGIDQKVEMDTLKILKLSGFSLSHEMIYNSDVRKFFDDNINEAFYDNKDIFIDSLKTHDEVRQKQFGNKFSLNYKYLDKFSSRLSFYNEQMIYKYNIRPDTSYYRLPIADTIVKTSVDTSISNSNVSIYLKAILFNHVLFSGYGEYYISGYKKENSKIDLKFAYILWKNTELSLEGNYTNARPDYFYKNYSSNNFRWENDCLRRIEEWDAGFAIRSTRYKLQAKIQYGQITNHVYLDTTAYVKQHQGQINIISGELSKKLMLGPIHSVTRFVYQQSTNDSILSLPKYSLYQSLYYERLANFSATGGKLLWQVGVDYHYTSEYMADGYMPTTGLFYRQFDHEQMDHHCFDVFINFTIKRVRLYLKYNYLNSAINKNYYFTGPYYPSPEPIFKFGLAWTFYD